MKLAENRLLYPLKKAEVVEWMKKYASRWLFDRQEVGSLDAIRGKNFCIKFESPVSDKWTGEDPRLEAMIFAQTFQIAQSVMHLIQAADCLIDTVANSDDIDFCIVNAVNDEEENRKIRDHFGLFFQDIGQTRCFQKPGSILALKITGKASFRTKYIIGLHKYFISCGLHSTHWVYLDPGHSANIPLSQFTHDHLRYAYAIMIAYSIIEELQLEIRASSKKPSHFSDGTWNPKVKCDLERRLTAAHIDLSEPVPWNVRGGITTLEKRRKPNAIGKAEWAHGAVRDCEVNIIDAINDLSWLRSKITAHKVDKDIRKLSIYDVANAQHLARRLLLATMGFWKKYSA